jgi:hypothetical protein
MNWALKIKICTTMVEPALVYGSETWPVTERDMKRMITWVIIILRKISRPVVEHVLWRIRNNQELWELHKDVGIAADIKRLEWIGYVGKLDNKFVVKKIFYIKLEGRRIMGGPGFRYWRLGLEDVEKDLREMKLKNVDRRQWTEKNWRL